MFALQNKFVDTLRRSNKYSDIDLYFGNFLYKLGNSYSDELLFIAACVSRYNREGHICFDLNSSLASEIKQMNLTGEIEGDPQKLVRKLFSVGVAGLPGEFKPLIIDSSNKIYLHRYWNYQNNLASLIKSRVEKDNFEIENGKIKKILSLLLTNGDNSSDPERIAAAVASLLKRFVIITGGPGTGKTTFALNIALLLLELLDPAEENFRILLAAPTGKGAARLSEAVNNSVQYIKADSNKIRFIPSEAQTIHRILKNVGGTPFFYYNADNKLPVDLLIVDEASMIDMALMSKLMEAIPLDSHVILLGDKDQLASVEAGSMLGDICESGDTRFFSDSFTSILKEISPLDFNQFTTEKSISPLSDSIIEFNKNFRFPPESGIGILSNLIKEGNLFELEKIIKKNEFDDIEWIENRNLESLKEFVFSRWEEIFAKLSPEMTIEDKFQIYNSFRILNAHRVGPWGSLAINKFIEAEYKRKNKIHHNTQWYPGKPIMIFENNYDFQLFNGDSGIVLEEKGYNGVKVFFEKPGQSYKIIEPALLPENEAFYSMTVHKSQGSEFDHILLVLPDEDSPILSRELIYTAITRAKKRVEIWGNKDVFLQAVGRKVKRTSGLSEALKI